MAGCLDCNISPVCDVCDTTDHFSKVGDKCKCDSKYFLNSRNCTLCSNAIKNCETCDNAN